MGTGGSWLVFVPSFSSWSADFLLNYTPYCVTSCLSLWPNDVWRASKLNSVHTKNLMPRSVFRTNLEILQKALERQTVGLLWLASFCGSNIFVLFILSDIRATSLTDFHNFCSMHTKCKCYSLNAELQTKRSLGKDKSKNTWWVGTESADNKKTCQSAKHGGSLIALKVIYPVYIIYNMLETMLPSILKQTKKSGKCKGNYTSILLALGNRQNATSLNIRIRRNIPVEIIKK